PVEWDAKAFTGATFIIRERDRTTQSWEIRQIKAIASSGETRTPFHYQNQRRDDGCCFYFGGALWLEEPAWKLQVELSRTADFPPEELWLVKGVPVPADGESSEVHAKTNMYGAGLEFLSLSSPNAVVPNNIAMPGHYNLHAEVVSEAGIAHLTLVAVKDDQGREVRATDYLTFGPNDFHVIPRCIGLDILKDAKSLDVTFAFSESVKVEFLAKPVMGAQNGEQK
ncbi:MAG TPA: hypothetical protein VH598_00940, partial [Verrucomicrobiae bacterium]|nr:hypothetical protein [Verrucomicrobiae bacterium]